ncbi:hypothetical protein PV04_05067 [Phialophora macrospora]|uniref:Uncharacterized protein n=1 Tax=Phialophora macrospora TaxID=1851006 RepID=A0A0D2GAV5_9EURO|nr:hypothetical protein PV04_05067 [Phialophora macrospora]
MVQKSTGPAAVVLTGSWTFTSLSGTQGRVPVEEALAKKPRGTWLSSQVADYDVKKMSKGSFYITCPDTDVEEALDQAGMAWGAGDVFE